MHCFDDYLSFSFVFSLLICDFCVNHTPYKFRYSLALVLGSCYGAQQEVWRRRQRWRAIQWREQQWKRLGGQRSASVEQRVGLRLVRRALHHARGLPHVLHRGLLH